MNSPNPYAPPSAAVKDIDLSGARQPVRMWSAAGRIGRLRYLANLTGAYLLIVLAGFIGGFLGGLLRSNRLSTALVVVAFIAYFVFFVLKTIQRSHDMEWSGWTCLLAAIPFVGLVWMLKSGSAGANRYGAPPPPNTLGVKILGLIFPIVTVIGIAAAIALPAYMQYIKQARAVQAR